MCNEAIFLEGVIAIGVPRLPTFEEDKEETMVFDNIEEAGDPSCSSSESDSGL